MQTKAYVYVVAMCTLFAEPQLEFAESQHTQ